MSHKKRKQTNFRKEKGKIRDIVEAISLAIKDEYISEKDFDVIYKEVKKKLKEMK